MPTKEIQAAITALEKQQEFYETLLNHSINDDEILYKTKIILQELRKVSQELIDLKILRGEEL